MAGARWLWTLLACALATAIVAACSSADDGRRILGLWEAESVKISPGLGVPIGPTLDITRDRIRVPGADIDVTIQKFRSDAQDVTLVLPFGFDLTFRFESTDHMFIELPGIGIVRYRRVIPAASAPVAAAPVHPVPASPASVPVAPPVVVAVPTSLPAVTAVRASVTDLAEVVRLAQAGDDDAALRALAVALAARRVDWSELDREQALAVLKADVRYQALMARWRPSGEPATTAR